MNSRLLHGSTSGDIDAEMDAVLKWFVSAIIL